MKSYVASQIAAKKAEGMLAPLLESDDDCEPDRDSDVDSSSSSEMEMVKQSPMQALKSVIVYLVLAAGVAASAAAMVAVPTFVTYMMGGLLIVTVPHSVIKERQLTRMPPLHSMNNKLRDEANHLKEQLDALSEEINMLKPEVDRAAAVEEELRAIAEKQSFNVNRLVELVKENESVLAQMKVNLRQRICQDMVRIVMRSDINNDQIISKKEANLLALRVKLQLHEYGVVFDMERFLRFIGSDSSIVKLIGFARKLLQPDDFSAANEQGDADIEELSQMFYVAKNYLTTAAAGGECSLSMKPDNHCDPVEQISIMGCSCHGRRIKR